MIAPFEIGESNMLKIEILTAGDSAILIEFGKEISPEINRKITAIVQLIKEQQIEGIVDTIPAFVPCWSITIPELSHMK